MSSDLSLSINASIDCVFCHPLFLFFFSLEFDFLPPAHAVLWYSSSLTWPHDHFLCTPFCMSSLRSWNLARLVSCCNLQPAYLLIVSSSIKASSFTRNGPLSWAIYSFKLFSNYFLLHLFCYWNLFLEAHWLNSVLFHFVLPLFPEILTVPFLVSVTYIILVSFSSASSCHSLIIILNYLT